jgi:hypothetical protein
VDPTEHPKKEGDDHLVKIVQLLVELLNGHEFHQLKSVDRVRERKREREKGR